MRQKGDRYDQPNDEGYCRCAHQNLHCGSFSMNGFDAVASVLMCQFERYFIANKLGNAPAR